MSHDQLTVWITWLGALNNYKGGSNKALALHPNTEVTFKYPLRKKQRGKKKKLLYYHGEDIYRKFAFAHSVRNKLPSLSCSLDGNRGGVCEMSHWSFRYYERRCDTCILDGACWGKYSIKQRRLCLCENVCLGFQEMPRAFEMRCVIYRRTCLTSTCIR